MFQTRDHIVDELSALVMEVTGEAGKFGEMGSGDLPHIVAEWGGKEFSLGVIRPGCNIHGKDEFVYQKDIENLAAIISRFRIKAYRTATARGLLP